jgi:hypothetical protein
MGTRKGKQLNRFCRCIKGVRGTVKLRPGQRNRESAAIGICVKSVLQTRGKTLRSFSCKNGKLKTQKLRR